MSVAIKERPILFSGPMVRAILDGRKTQTRRIVKPQPSFIESSGRWHWRLPKRAVASMCCDSVVTASREWHEYLPDGCCPYGQAGDHLWVRETWKPTGLFAFDRPSKTKACGRFAYQADTEQRKRDETIKWRPSIHMPRWASRITLEITGVRVERLNDISEEDAKAEGIESQLRYPDAMQGTVMYRNYIDPELWHYSPESSYQTLWESINGAGSWAANPWVWVIEFKRV